MAVDDALYGRAYNGQKSRRHQAAMRQKARRIAAAGMTKEVTFEPAGGPINDLVDDAYRAKYHGSPYLSRNRAKRAPRAARIAKVLALNGGAGNAPFALSPMIGARARAATVKVTPRECA